MSDIMTLGRLIVELQFMPDLPVKFDDGRVAREFDSWRGRPEELTLHPGYSPSPDPITARELLKKSIESIGASFSGRKGGTFVMTRDTPVWADDPYDADYRAIVDCRQENNFVVLVTEVQL